MTLLFSSWDTPGLGKRWELMKESCFPSLEDILSLLLDTLGTTWQGRGGGRLGGAHAGSRGDVPSSSLALCSPSDSIVQLLVLHLAGGGGQLPRLFYIIVCRLDMQ